MCDIDDPGRNTSSSVSSSAPIALADIQPSVSSVCVTPLAGPVLPEVKKIAAGAVRSGGSRSRCAAAVVVRPSSVGPSLEGPPNVMTPSASSPAS